MSAHTLETYSALFGYSEIGKVTLDNRIALAPMTRTSATAEGNPTDRMGDYYRVFAEGGFGLLITEGLYIDQHASQGYLFQPGIATGPGVGADHRPDPRDRRQGLRPAHARGQPVPGEPVHRGHPRPVGGASQG